MVDPKVLEFIKNAQAKGYSRTDIEKVLISKGWKPQQLAEAFGATATTGAQTGAGSMKIADLVKQYKAQGQSEAQIRQTLLGQGFNATQIDSVLKATTKKVPLLKNKLFLTAIAALGVLVILGLIFGALLGGGPECTRDAECGASQICQANTCIDVECTSDLDCGTGFECSQNNCVRADVAPEVECVRDFDCGVNEQCVGGECIFVAPVTEPEAECFFDEDCGPGFECFEGVCFDTLGGAPGVDVGVDVEEQLEVATENYLTESLNLVSLTDQRGTFEYAITNTGSENLVTTFDTTCTLFDETNFAVALNTTTHSNIAIGDTIVEKCTLNVSQIYERIEAGEPSIDVTVVFIADTSDAIFETDEEDNILSYTDTWAIESFLVKPDLPEVDKDEAAVGEPSAGAPENTCPIINAQNLEVVEGELLTAITQTSDIDGDVVTVTYNAPLTVAGAWQTQSGDVGTYTVTAIANDGTCDTPTTFTVTVVEELVFWQCLDDATCGGFGASYECVNNVCQDCVTTGTCFTCGVPNDPVCGNGFECDTSTGTCKAQACIDGIDNNNDGEYDIFGACQLNKEPKEFLEGQVSHRQIYTLESQNGVYSCATIDGRTEADCEQKCEGFGGTYLPSDSGCSSIQDIDEGGCSTTADCGSRQLCEDNVCVDVECRSNSHCSTIQASVGGFTPAGDYCHTQRNECVECQFNHQCEGTAICTEHNVCEEVECISNNDCDTSSGQRCSANRCTQSYIDVLCDNTKETDNGDKPGKAGSITLNDGTKAVDTCVGNDFLLEYDCSFGVANSKLYYCKGNCISPIGKEGEECSGATAPKEKAICELPTKELDPNTKDTIFIRADKSTNEKEQVDDFCLGDSSYLSEYLCAGDLAKGDIFECTFGCEDGKCKSPELKFEAVPTTIQPGGFQRLQLAPEEEVKENIFKRFWNFLIKTSVRDIGRYFNR